MWNFVVVHEAVPAELIYALTQALSTDADEVRAAYPTAAAMTCANAVANTFLPFHPGAARYYREKAVPVRPGLLKSKHILRTCGSQKIGKHAQVQQARVTVVSCSGHGRSTVLQA